MVLDLPNLVTLKELPAQVSLIEIPITEWSKIFVSSNSGQVAENFLPRPTAEPSIIEFVFAAMNAIFAGLVVPQTISLLERVLYEG